MKNTFIILIMVFLVSNANAETLGFQVKNINNKLPIANASISIYNPDHSLNITDSDGLFYFEGIKDNIHYYNISKIGYFPIVDESVNLSGDTLLYFYMTPISNEGLIRVRFMDDNPIMHRICIFYAENNRLAGCYDANTNQSVSLITNRAYYLYPDVGFIDNFNTLGTILNYLNRFGSWLIGLFLLFAIIHILVKK